MFHFALRPGGYLFLGTSESVDGAGDLFVAVDKDAHIFESRARRRDAAAGAAMLPASGVRAVAAAPARASRGDRRDAPAGDLHQRLLEQLCAAVGRRQRGARHRPRVRAAPGASCSARRRAVAQPAASWSIPELRLELRTALYQAAQRADDASKSAASRCRIDDGGERVDIIVRPVLRDDDAARGFFLVMFDEHDRGADAPSAPIAR